jgi:hypothetical protein
LAGSCGLESSAVDQNVDAGREDVRTCCGQLPVQGSGRIRVHRTYQGLQSAGKALQMHIEADVRAFRTPMCQDEAGHAKPW